VAPSGYPGNKLMEVNSQAGDELSSGPSAYPGPTVNYELNKTYHITVNYDDDHKILSIAVKERLTGKEIWSYFINTAESLHGMNRIFLGSKGDYGPMYVLLGKHRQCAALDSCSCDGDTY